MSRSAVIGVLLCGMAATVFIFVVPRTSRGSGSAIGRGDDQLEGSPAAGSALFPTAVTEPQAGNVLRRSPDSLQALRSRYEQQLSEWKYLEVLAQSEPRRWAEYHNQIGVTIDDSPDRAHLEQRYYFIQQEDLAELSQSEAIVARNILIAELGYLRANGVKWVGGSSDRDRQYSYSILTGDALFDHPAETILRMPQFGIVDSGQTAMATELLQSIRLEFLAEHARLRLLRDQTRSLKVDPAFASPEAQEFLDDEIARTETMLRDIRVGYLLALAQAVGAPEFPNF